MTRYVIVCAFDEPPPDALAEELELTDRLRLVRGEERPDLWISWASFHELEPRLAAALAEGKVDPDRVARSADGPQLHRQPARPPVLGQPVTLRPDRPAGLHAVG
jgi:hypothetical protein